MNIGIRVNARTCTVCTMFCTLDRTRKGSGSGIKSGSVVIRVRCNGRVVVILVVVMDIVDSKCTSGGNGGR